MRRRRFSRCDISQMFVSTGSRWSAFVSSPSSPAASCTARARYGFAEGSGIRSSSRVPVPRRSGMRINGDRLCIDQATFTGAS